MLFTAGLAIVWMAGLGYAAYATSKITEALLLFGMVQWATWFAWAGPLSVILVIAAMAQTWRSRKQIALGSKIGLIASSLALQVRSGRYGRSDYDHRTGLKGFIGQRCGEGIAIVS